MDFRYSSTQYLKKINAVFEENAKNVHRGHEKI